jgi:hypothetical protein
VAALVDEKNVESLIPEVIGYVRLADRAFRSDLVAKIFQSVQRFAPSLLWNFDTVLRLLIDSGNYVGTDVIVSFSNLIATSLAIRTHALKTLTEALLTNTDNQPLIQVASWALGEFQEDPSDLIDVLIRLTILPQTTIETKLVLITALAKLAARFGEVPKVTQHLQTFENNNHIEIQQRVGELIRVLGRPDVSEALLAPLEFEEVLSADPQARRSSSEATLLDLVSESTPADTASKLSSLPTPSKPPANAVEALRTGDYVLYFELQRNPANPAQLAVRSTIINLSAIPLTNFVVQYRAPQGWIVTAQPPSGTVLEAVGGEVIKQVFFLTNKGNLPLQLSAQISYMYRTQPITENGNINPIFG